jgi:outer membrane protein assembly factor BamC
MAAASPPPRACSSKPASRRSARAASGEQVGQVSTDNVRVERRQPALAGGQADPGTAVAAARSLLADSGFTVETASQQTGIMETNWAENRAKIPQDFIRRTIGKVFDSAYSTGERDKFRTRLERRAGRLDRDLHQPPRRRRSAGRHAEGKHHLDRASERSGTRSRIPQPPDRQADRRQGQGSQRLRRRARRGSPARQARRHKVVLDEGFDRAWRRVGLALDRVGFTVEDRDRVQGVYFVRYVDPDSAQQGRLLQQAVRRRRQEQGSAAYRVLVSAVPNATSDRHGADNDGKPETSATGAKILKLLVNELK